MTHKDIYTKFMIEYDKAGASTSYPSLTEYEVATVLDKAYNALIAQKVTGNNVRRSTIESDIKSIADLGPLTKSEYLYLTKLDEFDFAQNVSKTESPEDMLYFLQASMRYNDHSYWTAFNNKKEYPETDYKYDPVDGIKTRSALVKLVNHEIAQKFFASASNIPWIKQPVCFIEDRDIYVVYDPLNPPVTEDDQYYRVLEIGTRDSDGNLIEAEGKIIKIDNYSAAAISALALMTSQQAHQGGSGETQWIENIRGIVGDEIVDMLKQHKTVSVGLSENTSDANRSWFKLVPAKPTFRVTYIRRPNTFVKDLPEVEGGYVSYFDYNVDPQTEWDENGTTFEDRYAFECNSTVAEELVSLAVAFALENVESSRLNSKLNMRGLEA